MAGPREGARPFCLGGPRMRISPKRGDCGCVCGLPASAVSAPNRTLLSARRAARPRERKSEDGANRAKTWWWMTTRGGSGGGCSTRSGIESSSRERGGAIAEAPKQTRAAAARRQQRGKAIRSAGNPTPISKERKSAAAGPARGSVVNVQNCVKTWRDALSQRLGDMPASMRSRSEPHGPRSCR